MKVAYIYILLLLLPVSGVLSGCKSQHVKVVQAAPATTKNLPGLDETQEDEPITSLTSVPIKFRLETQMRDGRMVVVGIGEEIDGVVNPDLTVQAGDTILATLVNGDGMQRDLSFPDFMAKSALVSSKGNAVEISFTVGEDKAGTYPYFCSLPGHRQAGMEGRLIVNGP